MALKQQSSKLVPRNLCGSKFLNELKPNYRGHLINHNESLDGGKTTQDTLVPIIADAPSENKQPPSIMRSVLKGVSNFDVGENDKKEERSPKKESVAFKLIPITKPVSRLCGKPPVRSRKHYHPKYKKLPIPPEKEKPSYLIPSATENPDIVRRTAVGGLFAPSAFEGPPYIGILRILMKWQMDESIPQQRKGKTSARPRKIKKKEEVKPIEIIKPAVQLHCQFNGPGPGQYDYYTCIGLNSNDPTRKKCPSYTFGYKRDVSTPMSGPGPAQYNTEHLTRTGKAGVSGITFGGRKPINHETVSPGPAARHMDKSILLYRTAPRARLFGKPKERKPFVTPGSIGQMHHFGGSKPFPIMFGKCMTPKKPDFPPPNAYEVTEFEVYKPRMPSFTMGYRRPIEHKGRRKFPEPIFYSPNFRPVEKKSNVVVIGRSKMCCQLVPMDMPEKKK